MVIVSSVVVCCMFAWWILVPFLFLKGFLPCCLSTYSKCLIFTLFTIIFWKLLRVFGLVLLWAPLSFATLGSQESALVWLVFTFNYSGTTATRYTARQPNTARFLLQCDLLHPVLTPEVMCIVGCSPFLQSGICFVCREPLNKPEASDYCWFLYIW